MRPCFAVSSVHSQTLSLLLSSTCLCFPLWECWRHTRALRDGSSEQRLLETALPLLAACTSSFVYPLDWGEPWQLWPIPTTYGVLLGYAMRDCAGLAKLAFRSALQAA